MGKQFEFGHHQILAILLVLENGPSCIDVDQVACPLGNRETTRNP